MRTNFVEICRDCPVMRNELEESLVEVAAADSEEVFG